MSQTLGVIETVYLVGGNGTPIQIKAKIDSGAEKSSIDESLVDSLEPVNYIDEITITNANGQDIRKVIQLDMIIKGKRVSTEATIADREHLENKVLIGRETLSKTNFLINPNLEGN